jgi:hypothetical protein
MSRLPVLSQACVGPELTYLRVHPVRHLAPVAAAARRAGLPDVAFAVEHPGFSNRLTAFVDPKT